ncbi:MAG TPA: BatA domain-containing protein, partial [Gemmatimonadaceae bacterium]|nr:BatA domain-containing protein [Gemmatimonadaceae bacterium]
MTFLAPAFLFALAAVALPILLHLLQRERREPVVFPSLMFLQRIPHQAVRRQRLKHLLLLALRCLVLALLAFAFARPFLRGRLPLAGASRGGGRELVLLLDRSASMGFGERWVRAQGEARRVVEGLGGDDRATLVLFDASAAVVAPATDDRAVLLAALASARPGAAGTRYAPALRLAQQRLAESERPRREVVLVTDFQRGGWDGAADVRLPAG